MISLLFKEQSSLKIPFTKALQNAKIENKIFYVK
jgi:hypothetical protein